MQVVFLGISVDGPGHGRAETHHVGSAFDGVDVVGEGKNLLFEAVVVLKRDLHHHVVVLAG